MKKLLIAGAAVAALALPVVAVYSQNEFSSQPRPVLAASTTCDPSVARAYPDAKGGAAIYVTTSGSTVVTVDVQGSAWRDHRRLSQQVTRGHDGASFDFGAIPGIEHSKVNVSFRDLSCDLTPPPSWGTP